MKRIIPFLLLAFVAVACDRDGPTVPVDGPQLAVDCTDPKFENHPQCSGGGGEEGDESYIATDLETRRGNVPPTWAYDVSDDPGNETVTVAGGTRVGNQYLQAMTWTVTGTDVVDGPVPLPLDDPAYQDVFAFGISDNGSYIVGRARMSTDTAYADWVQVSPVRWNGGPGELLDPVDGYTTANAVDVNNSGQTAGYSMRESEEPPRVATLWDVSGAAHALGWPHEGKSTASGINNQGHVVGGSWDPVEGQWHAILWRSDGYCDLGVGSFAHDITDAADGTVLVAGDSGSPEDYQPAVWQVAPASCFVSGFWTMGGGPTSYASDVRRVDGGWEAVGIDTSNGEDQPMVWHSDGTGIIETHLATDGRAQGINSYGQIAGEMRVKRLDHAVLWTPNPNQ